MESDNSYSYGIKSVFAQTLALTGTCFIQIGIGSEMVTSTVVIGALKNCTVEKHLTMTNEQESWFGSLLFLFTPLGSVLSSLMLSRLGHKNCMILTNVPYIMSQIMFFYATTVETLYACSILMGLSIGFSSGPCSAYVGEVCEPKRRGSLMSAVNVFSFVGYLVLTMIYSITMRWRLTILISIAIPVINTVLLYMTPNSPMWLLARGKPEKAHRTLSKLRGWVSPENCSNEFKDIIDYTSENNNAPNGTDKNDTSSWKQLLEPEVVRPFCLLTIYFFFANLLAGIPFGPYLVEVFTKFGAPVNVEWTITFSVSLAIIGGILTIFLVNQLGKRFLTLFTLLICSVCYILIGLIGAYWTGSKLISSWTILILYLTTVLTSSFGIMPIGWILLTEIFPMKSRNITCSIGSAMAYLLSFFMVKYYPAFCTYADFYNTFTIFGVSGVLGCVYFYYYLPETENKTLQEISEFFK